MDSELQSLIFKKYRARRDQDLKYMVRLLEANPEDVGDIVSMVKDFMRDMESHIRIFKASHEEYMEKVKGCATGGKEEIDFVVREHSSYLGKVKEGVRDVLLLFDKFKHKVMIPECKDKLGEKFELYMREKSRIEWAILEFDSAPIGITWRSLARELPYAELLKRNLREAF